MAKNKFTWVNTSNGRRRSDKKGWTQNPHESGLTLIRETVEEENNGRITKKVILRPYEQDENIVADDFSLETIIRSGSFGQLKEMSAVPMDKIGYSEHMEYVAADIMDKNTNNYE